MPQVLASRYEAQVVSRGCVSRVHARTGAVGELAQA
jgi:hypothetical protein